MSTPFVRVTVEAAHTLLREKHAPEPEEPLTVTNSLVLHLIERIAMAEHVIGVIAKQNQQLIALIRQSAGEGGGGGGGAGAAEIDDDEPVIVGNSTVVPGAVSPGGPSGAVGAAEAPQRPADNTPFPQGVPVSAPPGAGVRTTVIASEAPATGGGKKGK